MNQESTKQEVRVNSEEDVTMRIIKYNSMVFDQIFGAFQPKPILPVGDVTDQEEAEPDLEWRGGKFV